MGSADLPRSAPGEVRLVSVEVAALRNLTDAELGLESSLTLIHGPNGAGKSSVLEAVCLALVGRSPRTARRREVITFGCPVARAEATVDADGERRRFLWSADRSGEGRHLLDGKPATAGAASARPPLAVFEPDRLELVKGGPGPRRARVDRLAAALWPGRAGARDRYRGALAQRNALLARAGGITPPGLDAWDRELAEAGVELMRCRSETVDLLADEFTTAAADLGLADSTLRYRPRSGAGTPDELAAELVERRPSDLARGFSGHGPHLDELELAVAGRAARRYASQGEQRTALLALLFAERRVLLDAKGCPPLMILDDVMSELDPDRRLLLATRLREGGGQALITATEPAHLPAEVPRAELEIREGRAMPRAVGEAAA